MNAVIMDNVEVGDECIIGALWFVPEGMKIPKRKVVVGNPAKIVKDVTDDMAKWKTEGTKIYQALPKQLHETLKECDPLREIPGDMPEYKIDYRTWGDTKYFL
ncbi:MAG TPA: hypothetical protein ENN33_05965 [Ignavibacteria bacterium]|nr:hypothetical protein [Ignavibacteria bacterium]